MSWKIISAIILQLGCVFTAHAVESDIPLTDPVIWSNAGAGEAIRVTTPGRPIINNWGCSDPDSYFVLITLPQQAQSRIFAVLLAAKASGKQVTVRVSGCQAGRPAIISAYF